MTMDTHSLCSDMSDSFSGHEDLEVFNVTHDIKDNTRPSRLETPATIATTNIINYVRSRRLLRVLFDSELMKTLVSRSTFPKGVVTQKLLSLDALSTIAGGISTVEMITVRNLRLPEFDATQRIEERKVCVLGSSCQYL